MIFVRKHLVPTRTANQKILSSLILNIFSAGVLVAGSVAALAQTVPAKVTPKAATKPATAPIEKMSEPSANRVALVDAQPVNHARSAAISSCLPAISELSRLTLDAPHTAMSTWNKTDANDHMFSSVIGLKYENNIAPRAIAIIAAAPNSKRACDGGSVQIQPSTLSCDAIQKNLIAANYKSQDLNGITLVQSEGPLRFALLPTGGNGCTVVSIGSYFAK